MKSQLSNHPLGRHFLSCTRCIHVNLNLSMLVLAAATLYLAVTAYTGLNPELMLYYHYEPINVMVLTGCAIALVLAALVGIFSSMALYFDGLVGNAIILLILVVGMTGYTIWQSITKDYTRTGELFTQLGDDIHTYPRFEEMIDTMQRELSCCGAEGFTDWTEALPVSCCPGEKNNCNPDTPSLNRGGCFDRLSEVLRYYNWMILIALGFLNSVQTVAVALSYTLCRAIRYKRAEEPPTAPAYEPEPEPELEAEPEPEPEPAPEPVPEPAPQPETAPEPQTETVIIPIPPPMPPSKNILVVNLA